MAKQSAQPSPSKPQPTHEEELVIPAGTDERTELILRLGNLNVRDKNRIVHLMLSHEKALQQSTQE